MKLIAYILRIAFAFLFYTDSISAQVIKGFVRGEDNAPLIGAHVRIDNTTQGTVTEMDGSFVLSAHGNEGLLIVEYVGYESTKVKYDKSTSSGLVIHMKPALNELKAVTITAGSFEASDKKKGVALKPLDIVTTAGALGDINGALQTLPGTTTVGESGMLFVRGGDAYETQVFVDGMLVPVPYTTSAPNQAVRGRFNPFMFEGTIFNTGGYSAEYGQALSSVLVLETKGKPEEDQVDLGVMSVGADATITKTWDRGALIANGSYYNLGPYMSLVDQNVDWIEEPEVVNTALSFRQQTGESGLIKAYGTYNNTNSFLNYTSLDEPVKQESLEVLNDNIYVNGSWKTGLGDKWIVTSGFSYTENEDNLNFEETQIKEKYKGAFGKLKLHYFPNSRVNVKIGSDWTYKKYANNILSRDRQDDYYFDDNTYAAYTEGEIYLSEKFALRVGGRVEYSDFLEEVVASPRFSAAYQLSDESQLNLSYGQFYQQPNNTLLVRSRPGLQHERADHYILSYQINKGNRFIRLEAFQKDYENLVRTNGELYDNTGDGHARGIDVFYKDWGTIPNGQFWLSYSYLDTKRDYLDYPHEAIPTFANEHSVSLVYKHALHGIRSYPNLTFQYSSARRYNDPNLESFNSEKLKPFSTLNLSWSYLYRENVIFFASVSNVLGREHEFGYQFSPTPNDQGMFNGSLIEAPAKRFFLLGCFWTFSKGGNKNQLDKLN